MFASYVWLPASLLIAWQAMSTNGVLDPLFFPPPTALIDGARSMWSTGDLQRHLSATLIRMFRGFLIGASLGVVCGLAMGASVWVRNSLDPLISAAWASPKLTLLPMLIIIFGVNDVPKVILISLGCFIVVALYTLDGVRGVDRAYIEVARSYGAGPMALIRRVYAPAVMPAIFTAMRLSLGRALTLTVSIELVNSNDGLGSLVFLAWQAFKVDRLYVAIVVTAALGMLFHVSLRWLERRLITWRTSEEN